MGEYRSTRGEKPPATPNERRRKLAKNIARVVVAVAAVYLLLTRVEVTRRVPASGYATTWPYAEVRSPVAGVVKSIDATSGAKVGAGDALVRLNDDLERAALLKAEAEAGRARSELEFGEAEYAEKVRSHSNAVQVASLTLDYARRKLAITKQLVDKGLASTRDLMADEHQVAMATLAYGQLDGRDVEIGLKRLETLRRQLGAAEVTVSAAKADLEARTVRAPAAGQLFRHTFYPGEVVRSDQVLYEIFGDKEKLLRLRVPERYATHVATGMPVRVQFRTEKRLMGRKWVFATVGEMRGAIQAEGNDTYRVIYCPYNEPDFDVPPGTTADAEIAVGKVPLWRFVFND